MWPFKHKHRWDYFMSFYMPSVRWCFGCAEVEYENEQGEWEARR